MGVAAKKGNTSYYIHSIIFLLITIGTGFLPTFGGITELGMKVLGVFLGLLYGWIFIGFIWPSLFGMLALGMTGYASIIDVFIGGFGHANVLKLFFVFIFAGIMQTTGLTNFLANWCVSRKICRGRPWFILSVLFAVSIVMSGFMNPYATIVLVWYIFYGICDAVGLKKGDPIVSYTVVGVVVMCTMGAMMLPFLPISVIWRSMLQDTILNAYTVPMGTLIIVQLLLSWTLVFGWILFGRFVLRIDTSAIKNLSPEYFAAVENAKMTKIQKTSMASLIGFVAILVAPIVLPEGSALRAAFLNIDILGASVIMIIFFCFMKDENQKPLYNFGRMVTEGINWDIIVLFAATFPISAAMESEDTGIIKTVVGALMPIFKDMSPTLYLIIVALVFLVVTQVTHNMILGIVFTPVLATIGIDMGINPYLFQIFFAWALQLAFMTPGASANSALIFANSNWIDTKSAYKYTAFITIFGAALLLALLPVIFMLF